MGYVRLWVLDVFTSLYLNRGLYLPSQTLSREDTRVSSTTEPLMPGFRDILQIFSQSSRRNKLMTVQLSMQVQEHPSIKQKPSWANVRFPVIVVTTNPGDLNSNFNMPNLFLTSCIQRQRFQGLQTLLYMLSCCVPNLNLGCICDSTCVSRWRYCLLLPYVHRHLLLQNSSSLLILHSAIFGVTPPFNNSEFINNFSQSFMNFVLAQDPNVKWDSTNTVPNWPRWTEEGRTEMLFNRTGAYKPVFHTVNTKGDLLRRCE